MCKVSLDFSTLRSVCTYSDVIIKGRKKETTTVHLCDNQHIQVETALKLCTSVNCPLLKEDM